jgi:hypothetical protein
MTFKQRIEKAQKTNRQRDATEQKCGYASPHSRYCLDPRTEVGQCLLTGLQAISAGLKTEHLDSGWDCVAEGLVILLDLVPPELAKNYV